MTRIAVIGSTGQLGSDLVAALQNAGRYAVIPLTHANIECTDPDSVRTAVTAAAPEIVVNCAAFVRVDECEDRADEAFRVNGIGALYVARTCAAVEALCVYISTDYVFDGEKGQPYTEEDGPRPVNVYGASKLSGEYLTQQACPRSLIVRTASLFGIAGARGKGGNFVDSIVAKARRGEPMKVVNDIRMSPTYTRDAAQVMERLLRERLTGLVHLTNAGSCTWYEFAAAALDFLSLRAQLEPVSSTSYPMEARRPQDSSLRSTRLPALSGDGALRPWPEALKAYVAEKGYTQVGALGED